ncbi:MAG: rhodanese-related sulfurtransferase [Patescibacteria group bacterium]
MEHQIILFYKYVHIDKPEEVKAWHEEVCTKLGLTGRCIIASEGINATFEGTSENIKKYLHELERFQGTCPVKDREGSQREPIFNGIHYKYSAGTGNAFPKLCIKVRKEIVSLHLACDIDPNQVTGIHLPPEELHEWIANKKEFYIVDMRNVYEHKVGHFAGSILPPIENFRDLPKVVEQIKHLKNKTVLTVCTGGVRCEKASGFLITQGFTDVYQLDGGIVSYMEKYPNEDFKGKLYVFDKRITMGFYTDDTKHEVVGKCDECGENSENFVNCNNPVCHRHFLNCHKCIEKNSGKSFCPGGCVLSRHGRKISPVEAASV